ncbi:hypothetical protein IWQ62_003446 [Dispira parvispora]|uniref:DUF98 domain-containing protein n=1 Tax=Dispira parvispora TaxID=1520584 RepID=A0A9W8AU24_9FUNG|nr:hypothetical protein IWQ62_003446 [Dispira parvispora]
MTSFKLVPQDQSSTAHVIVVSKNVGDGMAKAGSHCVLPQDNFTTPLQRVLLWANGNLQRILSAFHNTPVSIKVLHHKAVDPDVGLVLDCHVPSPQALLYDRKIHLVGNERLLCVANSKIVVWNETFKNLLVNEGVGIGQIFHYCKIVPDFRLLRVGEEANGSFWRLYSLSTDGIYFEIHEWFPSNVFDSEIDTHKE